MRLERLRGGSFFAEVLSLDRPSLEVPFLAIHSLRGFDGVDNTVAKLRPAAYIEEEGGGSGQEGEGGARDVDCLRRIDGHGRDVRAA